MASKKFSELSPEEVAALTGKRKIGYEAWLAKQTDANPSNDKEGDDAADDGAAPAEGEAKTAGEDAGAIVAANILLQKQSEEERIQAIVELRLKEELMKREASSVLLSADEYAPRHENTMVPMVHDGTGAAEEMFGRQRDPVNNPSLWQKVSREDFHPGHAQALINHFRRLSETMKKFDMLTAVNTQLVKK